MERPPDKSPSWPNDPTGQKCDAEQVVVLPPQFSLTEVLLVTAEVGLCCALWQVDSLARTSPVLLGAIFALIHVSRGRVALGVMLGTVVGVSLMLGPVLSGLANLSYVWFFGSFLVPTCALYGGALNAIAIEQKLYGLPALALLLSLFSIAGMCVFLR